MQLWIPGQTLKNGRFIVEKILGGGGFGVTYRVFEQKTSKLFAIKTLNPVHQSQANFEEKQEQFVNEALRLRGCQHPHIVKVYEVIQEAGLWGMVMEYLEGDDLWVYIDKHGKLSEDEALRYINQVGQALEYVHQQGFLHRDVKPSNIILRQDKKENKKESLLIDFGLAREFTIGKTLSMTNSKTEGYAPIEQYDRKGHFTNATDVYALAATLYSLLTAEVPFPANFRKQGIQLPPAKQFNSSISDRVNDAIIRGMKLEQQDRPQTVQEWLASIMPNQAKGGLQQRNDEIQLKTTRMDYTRLRDLLVAGEWKKADLETERVILTLAGREEEDWLHAEHFNYVPCEDLSIIDQLWVEHSNGRFGFSVQQHILQSLLKTMKSEENIEESIWEAFGNRVGWRENGEWLYYSNTNFSTKAPVAHLPVGFGVVELGIGEGSIAARLLFSGRMKACQIQT